MSVRNIVFPLEVSSWDSTVMFSTTVVVGDSGHEIRNRNWQDPLHRYNARFSVRTKADVNTLRDFFIAMGGRENAFLVKDYQDYAVEDWTAVSETITGAEQTFQLYKEYDDGLGNTYSKQINKVRETIPLDTPWVKVRENGVEKTFDFTTVTAGSTFTVDHNAGTFTYNPSSSSNPLEFKVVEYYTPARFETDEFAADVFFHYVNSSNEEKALVQLPDVPLVEVRV